MITLVIIGVIAALTVPSLINKTNNQEYVSRLKKAYSTLSQATNLILAEEGTLKGEDNWGNSSQKTYELYKKHLISAKDCNNQSGCFKQGTYSFLNGDPAVSFDSNINEYKLILSDGIQVLFTGHSSDCSITWIDSQNACSLIYVDLNGEKKQMFMVEMFLYF